MSEEATDFEALARSEGWVPPEEWKGDPPRNGFLSAEEFVERGKTVIPIINAKLRKEQEARENLEKTLSEVKSFYDKSMERQRQELQSEIARLKKERAQAISEGDGDRFDKIDAELQQLQSVPQQPPAELQQWLSANDWYQKDPALQAWADGRANQLRAEGTPPGKAILDRIAKEAREAFPERFEKPKPPSPETGRRQTKKSGRSYDDLPAEAKAACDRFCKTIKGFTKEDYLANYSWD